MRIQMCFTLELRDSSAKSWQASTSELEFCGGRDRTAQEFSRPQKVMTNVLVSVSQLQDPEKIRLRYQVTLLKALYGVYGVL